MRAISRYTMATHEGPPVARMTSLLLLLGLLSVATMLSRRGTFAFVTHVASTPLLLALGFALSPGVLAFLTPSTLDALTPALRVGIAWLAVLAGLSAGARKAASSTPPTPRTRLVDGVNGVVGAYVVAGACIIVAYVGQLFGEELGTAGAMAKDGVTLLGAAVLLGGILAPSSAAVVGEALSRGDVSDAARRLRATARREEILGALALVVAVALLPLAVGSPDAPAPPALAACIGPAIGLVLAAAQLLVGGTGEDSTTRHISLMGLVVLASGLAARAHVPEAVTAFVMGLALARSAQGAMLLERLAATERPVRLVATALIGAHLGLSLPILGLGALLALTRLLVKSAVVVAWGGGRARFDELSAAAGSSANALVFAGSTALALGVRLPESGLLATAAVAVVLTDAATLVARGWVRMGRAAPDADAHTTGAA